jgi:hypothetical protein
MGDPKTTPIQIIPTDFPNNKNDSVTMFDVSFKYPAIEPQIKQLAQLLGFDPNHIVMQTTPHVDGLVDEYERLMLKTRTCWMTQIILHPMLNNVH